MKKLNTLAILTAASMTAAFAVDGVSYTAETYTDTVPFDEFDDTNFAEAGSLLAPEPLLDATADQFWTLDLYFLGGEAAFTESDLYLRYGSESDLTADLAQNSVIPGGIGGTIADPSPFYEDIDANPNFPFDPDPLPFTGYQWVFDLGGETAADSVYFDFILDSRDNADSPNFTDGLFSAFFPDANVDNPDIHALFSTVTTDEGFTVVRLEDQFLPSDLDDKNDVVFAYRLEPGQPQGAVPEPSTYGLIGALVLGALIAKRRFSAKKA